MRIWTGLELSEYGLSALQTRRQIQEDENFFAFPPPKTAGFDENGEMMSVHSAYKNKGFAAQTPENDKSGGCHACKDPVCQKPCLCTPATESVCMKGMCVLDGLGHGMRRKSRLPCRCCTLACGLDIWRTSHSQSFMTETSRCRPEKRPIPLHPVPALPPCLSSLSLSLFSISLSLSLSLCFCHSFWRHTS